MDYQFPEGFPEVAQDLVQRLLVDNPDKRLGGYNEGPFARPCPAGVAWHVMAWSCHLSYLDKKCLEERDVPTLPAIEILCTHFFIILLVLEVPI
jgi:hypothetical protein